MLHNNQIETLQLTKLIDSNVSSTSSLLIKKSTVQDVEQLEPESPMRSNQLPKQAHD